MANPVGNRKNLKPWGPDNPPPKSPGRPRKRPLSEAYDDRLQMPLPEDMRVQAKMPKGATWADAMALQMAREALKGNVPAAKEMREAVEGKATQRVEISSPADRGFEVVVSFEAPAVPVRERNAAKEIVVQTNEAITGAITGAIVAGEEAEE